ncbi:hypothetical protein BDZ94DRAFT_1158012 [Collybia nuda]|uniref:Uncharacterized protein n=1 Tax=Collybia nuda TaxID=64659 RepID=A0A9P5YD60_9AGAR|nr:hypothetical protein BDZ94DRAFT_1158012 [Collybia nuda]
MGEEDMRVLECEIDIDHETSLKWNLTSKSLPEPESVFYVQPQQHLISLKLMCMPTQVIRTLYKNSDLSTATPEEVATKLFDLENEWPRKGTLVVAVNPHKAWGKTWLPIDLEPSGPALDLTMYICEGTNVVKFIQLADMAEKVFVLCATLPAAQDSEEECFWDVSKHLNMSPGPLKLHPAMVKIT